ncbi:MAG: 23S rRNA (pseudouridine(1915)-N(3))-methyltransferase RlmH [Candidatus Marinimicrobia bacterium]|nr:23S rRNA (pseudouridine(1915)-N(3))-methyltransferase RlmH [Candidatus Neomarinimicrobiota bacterium]
MAKNFEKRIKHDVKIDLVKIKDSNPESEGNFITAHLKKNHSFNIAMSEDGEFLTSQGLALLFKSRPEPITFIIGGPGELSDKVKKKSNMTLSLSSMTLTHEMAKIFLLEQIYRAISILKNSKYHKD